MTARTARTATERGREDAAAATGEDIGAPAPEAMLLGMLGSSAVGWAAAVNGEPAMVELHVNGELVERAPAGRPPFSAKDFALISPAPTGAVSSAADWFLLKMPAELRDGRSIAVEVRLGGAVLGAGDFRLFNGLKSKFVAIKDGVAQGYIANPVSDTPLPDVELLIDGTPVAAFTADPPTDDGRRRFAIPLELKDGESHSVSLRWAGSTTDLLGSPQKWRSPPSETQKARDQDLFGPRTHPTYILPHTELSAVADMMARTGLARRFPAVVADHAAHLWPALEQPTAPSGPRLNLIVAGSAFADVDTAFALTQILGRDGAAACHILLPSEEARRFAVDDHRSDARPQLLHPILTADFARFASRLPKDDLIVFLPPHAVVDDTFLVRLEAMKADEKTGFVARCAEAAVGMDGSILVATPSSLGWRPASTLVGAIRAGDFETHTRVRTFDFEGVRFHELELNVDTTEPAALAWQAPVYGSSIAAANLIAVLGEAVSEAQSAAWAKLAPRVRVAGPSAGGAADSLGYDGAFEPEALMLLAELVVGGEDVLMLEAGAPLPDGASLVHCRALASERSLHAIRHLEGPIAAESVAGLAALARAALLQPVFGYYLPPEPPPVRD